MRFVILLAAIALCVLLERTVRYRFRNAPFFRDYFTTDLVYLATALGLGTWMAALYVEPLAAWIGAHVPLPRVTEFDVPFWAAVPAALVLYDLGSWITHFLLHRYDTLWEFHKIHHSTRIVDWLATFRSHAVEQLLRNVIPPAIPIVLGLPLDATLYAGGLYAAFAVFNHSNTQLNLRSVEWLLITPRLHRMHHLTGSTCQKNFGTVFSLWDRLFGSFAATADESGGFGVPGETGTYPQSWLPQFVEPIKRVGRTPDAAQPGPTSPAA